MMRHYSPQDDLYSPGVHCNKNSDESRENISFRALLELKPILQLLDVYPVDETEELAHRDGEYHGMVMSPWE